MAWRQISRKTIYDTPFMSLHEDTVALENGIILDDFSVVEFHDGVVVVATDNSNKLIVLDEYKYAVDSTLCILPAGGVEDGDTPEETAIKELREETGYQAKSVEVIGVLYEHPSKLSHKTYIVRAYDAEKLHEAVREDTESIEAVRLLDFAKSTSSQFKTAVNVAALYMALERN